MATVTRKPWNVPSGPADMNNLGLSWKTTKLPNGSYEAVAKSHAGLRAEGPTPGVAVQRGEAAAMREYCEGTLQQRIARKR